MGCQRQDGALVEIEQIQNWVSPRLGIRFDCTAETLVVYGPSGEQFLTPVELAQQRDQALKVAEAERQRGDRLAARLQELGIDPESIWSVVKQPNLQGELENMRHRQD